MKNALRSYTFQHLSYYCKPKNFTLQCCGCLLKVLQDIFYFNPIHEDEFQTVLFSGRRVPAGCSICTHKLLHGLNGIAADYMLNGARRRHQRFVD
jgi:hypothetical protein